jgi:hypothetical protein
MGCRIGAGEEQAVRNVLKAYGAGVRLKRAVLVPHRYLLELEDVAFSDL